jgi:MFS family permease
VASSPGSTSLGRAFHLLWLATGAANLADGMIRFLFPVLALAVGAAPSGVAAVTAAVTLAWPLFGLHAGWLVDRADRRLLLTSVNFARALVLGVVAALYAGGSLTLPVILGAALLLGLAETIIDTALTSTVPLVVPPAHFGRANARLEATINAANELLGPSLAGLAAGVTLGLTASSSAGLYGLAAVVLLGLSITAPVPATTTAPKRALLSGLRFLWRHSLLRTLTLFTAAMNVVWAAATALLVVYAVTPGPLGLSPTAYGLLLTAVAGGGLVASVLTEPLRRRAGDALLLIIDCVGTVLLVLPVAAGLGTPFVAAGAVVAGAGSSVWRIINATIRQNLTPVDLLGRVYSASRVISWGVVPVSAGLAGLAADAWGLRAVFIVATCLAVAVALAFIPYAARAQRAARADRLVATNTKGTTDD